MRRNNRAPLVAPVRYANGNENTDVANLIRRAEMTSKPKKTGKEKKAVPVRSSQRRAASIERIFDKKKQTENAKETDLLQSGNCELKEKKKQFKKTRSSSISNRKQPIKFDGEKNTHKEVEKPQVEALPPPPLPPPPPPSAQQIPSYKPVQDPPSARQSALLGERQSSSAVRREGVKVKHDESIVKLMNHSMADRRKYLAPESDSDDEDADEAEETVF